MVFLLEAGADVFTKERETQKSALHLAAREYPELVERLVANSTQICLEGELQVLRNIEVQDAHGRCRYIALHTLLSVHIHRK